MYIRILLISAILLLNCSRVTNAPQSPVSNKHSSIIFVGNSLYGEGLNIEELTDHLDSVVELIWAGASTSSWHYATLCSLTNRKPKPSYVLLPLDHNWIMNPHDHVTGDFWKKLEIMTAGVPYALDTIRAVLAESSPNQSTWDFENNYRKTFLPRMINEAKRAGIKLIFTRMRFPRQALRKPSLKEEEKIFRMALADFCHQENIPLLDYLTDPEIENRDFGYGAHYNAYGRAKWTRQLRDDLYAILHNQPAAHQLHPTKTFALDKLPKCVDCDNDTITAGQKATFSLGNGKIVKWSYFIEGSPLGEIFVGEDSIANISPEPFDYRARKIKVLASDGIRNSHKVFTLITKPNANLPPAISWNPGYLTYVNRETAISMQVTDDKKTESPLVYEWKVDRGEGLIKSANGPSIVYVPKKAGLDVIYATVSDGEFTRAQNIRIIINHTNQYIIRNPSANSIYSPGETIEVKWESVDIQNCVISFSHDGGKHFIQIGSQMLTPSDYSWGSFKFVIPLETPETVRAIVKLNDYHNTVTTYSPMFRIVK